MSLNADLARIFHHMADLMDIKGENTFKVLAFRKVGRLLEDLRQDIRQIVEAGDLESLAGIGKSSARIIEQYVTTGRATEAEEIAASVPAGLIPMLQIEGLGPKTAGLLWRERGITSIDELSKAIETGALKGIKGIGDKKIESMRKGLEVRAKSAGRIGIAPALEIAQQFLEAVRRLPKVERADVAGSLRRRKETIGDLDILVCIADAADGSSITAAFAKLPGVDRVLTVGPIKASVMTESGVQVDLRVLPAEHFGAALMYFTGSKEHNVKIRGHAQKLGMTLNEWGLYKLKDYEKAAKKTAEAPTVNPIAAETEEAVYRALKMSYVEPELREDRGEVEAAMDDALPDLITIEHIRGDLHSHTTASDGVASIEEMAAAAKARGYQYLAITDHSKSQVIANGLDPKRLLKHIAEIHRVGDKLKGITLLAGAEVDILPDGTLDYEDGILKELDFVVASPHFALKQDEPKATARMLRAIENRYVNLIGHPTGRLIGGREGLPLNFNPLFKAAAANGTAMEINAGYPRLDLNESNARAAIEAGVMLAIDTDAHSSEGLSEISLGIGVARRAWVTPKNVINCMKLADLRKFIARKR